MIAGNSLKSGKVLNEPVLKNNENQVKQGDDSIQQQNNDKDDTNISIYKPVVTCPRRLKNKNINASYAKVLDVSEQVQIKISLLEAIQQVPSYAKFLNDMCTVKRCHNIQMKAFLTTQAVALFRLKMSLKYKDPRCPTISCVIRKFNIEKTLLDLGASVNLISYSV